MGEWGCGRRTVTSLCPPLPPLGTGKATHLSFSRKGKQNPLAIAQTGFFLRGKRDQTLTGVVSVAGQCVHPGQTDPGVPPLPGSLLLGAGSGTAWPPRQHRCRLSSLKEETNQIYKYRAGTPRG